MYETFPPQNVPPDVWALTWRLPMFAAAADDLRIVPLQGVISLTNTNYRVEAAGTAYFLRIGDPGARHLGIRREEEIAAAEAAARAGIGPEVLYAEPEIGVLVMPFISGRHWEPAAFREPANRARLTETLRRLHSIRDVAAEGSMYRRIERMLDSAAALGLELPTDLDAHREKMARIEHARLRDPRYTPGLAHNDFFANNFLDDGERIYLIDWEFSGIGDPMIDLASISYGVGFNEAEQAAWLSAYSLYEPGDLATLQSMVWVVYFFEACWALIMSGTRGPAVEGGGFDYARHARRMFARLNDG